jgi:hypothetical protein
MNTPLPPIPEILFVLLTFFLLAVTVIAVRMKAENKMTALRVFLVLFFWLSFLKIISGMEFFHDYVTMPPRLMIAPFSCLIAIIILTASKKFAGFLRKIPLHWLIYLQSFRILMEIILYMLAEHGVIHERLSFAGRNFDILAGISALLVGWLVQKNKITKPWLITWNIACILLLMNIVILAILSTPYPFSIFRDEPVNTVVFYYPFIWLPGFVAPFALALHLFSLRKITTV